MLKKLLIILILISFLVVLVSCASKEITEDELVAELEELSDDELQLVFVEEDDSALAGQAFFSSRVRISRNKYSRTQVPTTLRKKTTPRLQWISCNDNGKGIAVSYKYWGRLYNRVYNDRCINSNLLDYSCSNNRYVRKYTHCQEGCSNNACISESDAISNTKNIFSRNLNRVSVAPAFVSAEECSFNFNLPLAFENYLKSFVEGNSNKIFKNMKLFQEHLNCINTNDLRIVDQSLAKSISNVDKRYKANLKNKMLNALYNPAIAVFDQLLYTGDSYTYDSLKKAKNSYSVSLQSYPAKDFWVMDLRTLNFDNPQIICNGINGCKNNLPLRLLNALQETWRLGTGSMGISEFIANGMVNGHGIECNLNGQNTISALGTPLDSGATGGISLGEGLPTFGVEDLRSGTNGGRSPFGDSYQDVANNACGGSSGRDPSDNYAYGGGGQLGDSGNCYLGNVADINVGYSDFASGIAYCTGTYGQPIGDNEMNSCGAKSGIADGFFDFLPGFGSSIEERARRFGERNTPKNKEITKSVSKGSIFTTGDGMTEYSTRFKVNKKIAGRSGEMIVEGHTIVDSDGSRDVYYTIYDSSDGYVLNFNSVSSKYVWTQHPQGGTPFFAANDKDGMDAFSSEVADRFVEEAEKEEDVTDDGKVTISGGVEDTNSCSDPTTCSSCNSMSERARELQSCYANFAGSGSSSLSAGRQQSTRLGNSINPNPESTNYQCSDNPPSLNSNCEQATIGGVCGVTMVLPPVGVTNIRNAERVQNAINPNPEDMPNTDGSAPSGGGNAPNRLLNTK